MSRSEDNLRSRQWVCSRTAPPWASRVQHDERTDPVDLFAALRMSPGKDLERPAHGIASIGEGRAIQLLMTAR